MIDTYMITPYKGYWLIITEDVKHQCLHCIAQNNSHYAEQVDEHGKVTQVLHKADKIEFDIDRSELCNTWETETQVIFRRFHAEVDYYLSKLSENIIAVDKFRSIRKYRCTHCGTTFETDNPGYTPSCCNCGALMEKEN